MPSIGDLGGIRDTLAYAVGIGAGTIPGNDLDNWPITQPSGDRGGLAVRQKIDHPVRLEVDQPSAIMMPAPSALGCLSTCRVRETLGRSTQSSIPRTRGVSMSSVTWQTGARRSSVSGLVDTEIRTAKHA